MRPISSVLPITTLECLDTYYEEYKRGVGLSITPEQASTLTHAISFSSNFFYVQNRRLKRKIDRVILPIFLITLTLQNLDRTSINYANLLGLRQDLKLSGTEFNWLAGIVYAGSFFGEYPLTFAIGRYPSQRVLSIIIVLWGLTVLLFTQCRTFPGALINRFFLGLFESAIIPGQTIMTGFWYQRSEIPTRQCIWFSGVAVAGLVGSYMAAGIEAIPDTAPGPKKWQYLFYILGSVTMAWGVFVWFFLPDSPAHAWFLNAEDRLLCIKRVAENHTGIKNRKFKADQAWESLRDPKVYLTAIAAIGGSFPNGVLATFSTQIIHEMGFSKMKSTLLKSVVDVVMLLSLLLAAYINLKCKNKRLITATVANSLCIVGASLLGYLPSEKKWLRLSAFWLTGVHMISFATSLMMVASNAAGYSHKIVSHGLIFAGVCWSNFGSPFVVKQNEAPRFPTAMAALVTGYSLKFTAQGLLLIYLVWSNAHRNKKYGPPDEAASREAGMQDKTEFENKVSSFMFG
ncbi:allantoate permease [Moniliophthora roreri MCA 2997]|uniref:Allantoate permease n=1 Tax=Moniliophthora roreri (strain MCA 2997) TaxID=1381753 RepID=V2XMK3_MONRO|nr:allantoate permease [Moniliophthora roreri MCA 2997]